MAFDIVGEDVHHAATIEQLALQQVRDIGSGCQPNGDRLVSSALPALGRSETASFELDAREHRRAAILPVDPLGDHSGGDGQIRDRIDHDESARPAILPVRVEEKRSVRFNRDDADFVQLKLSAPGSSKGR